jgi:hypothetical protein
MSPEITKQTYPKAQVPEPDRCQFTSSHGRRCTNPHNSNPNSFCIIHERQAEKIADSEAQSVSAELLSGGPNLQNRNDVGRVIAQLFTMIAQRRIRQREGALLAYVASLLLQTMGAVIEPADLPVRVVWDIPLNPDPRATQNNNSDRQFPNQT